MKVASAPARRFEKNTLLAYGALAGLWLLHVAGNFIWLKIDTRPPFWDIAGHVIAVQQLVRLPFISDWPAALRGLLTLNPYPPFVYLTAAPFAMLLWPSADVITGVITLFFGLLLLSTFQIGAFLGGKGTGLLAAFLVSMYPIVFGLSRHYLIDIPLTALTVAAIWFLLGTQRFERRFPALALGVALGLGMLTKWTFSVFLVAPLGVVFIQMVRQRASKVRWINLILALGIGAIITAPWYLYNFKSQLEFYGLAGGLYPLLEGDPLVGTVTSWLYYLQQFVEQQALLIFALAFVVGAVLLVVTHYPRLADFSVVLAWLIVPYLVLANFFNKDPRYTMPLLPAVAVITALGLWRCRPRQLKIGLTIFLGVYAVIQYLGMSFGFAQIAPVGKWPDRVALRVGLLTLPIFAEGVHIAGPAQAEDWRVPDILQAIEQSSANRQRPLKIVVVPNRSYFEPNVFMYFAQLERIPVEVYGVTGILSVNAPQQLLSDSDYVVVKSGNQGPAWTVQEADQLTSLMDDPSSDLGRQFDLLGEYALPDGSISHLYRHVSG
jgi:4-amino-4-deoxy-L-arabinose transferase-like glycosyltransferase